MSIKQETVNGGKKILLRHASGPGKGKLAGSVSLEGRDGIRDMGTLTRPDLATDIADADNIEDSWARFQLANQPLDTSLDEPSNGIDDWDTVWLNKRSPEEQIAYMAGRTLPAGLGEDQAHDVFEAARRAVRRIRPVPDAPTEEEWQAWVDKSVEQFNNPDNGMTNSERAEALSRLSDVNDSERPDGITFATMQAVGKRNWRARYALDDQARQIAAWVDVHEWDVKAKITEFRNEYYAAVDAGNTPELPDQYKKAWGRTGGAAPKDAATAWAHWRAENPENYLEPRPPKKFVALDLETTGLSTMDSHIIEIGFVEYDQNGTETGKWSQFVRPPLDKDGVLSTGSAEVFAVHGISAADVADAPTMEQVIPELQRRLQGATIIGHNLGFDTKHLRVNLKKHAPVDNPEVGRPTWVGEADTLFHASRHMTGLENNKLVTVSAALGVSYTTGHRAEHDARASGEVFFKVRDDLKARQAAAIAARDAQA